MYGSHAGYGVGKDGISHVVQLIIVIIGMFIVQ